MACTNSSFAEGYSQSTRLSQKVTQRIIKGNVTDDKQEPLVGATVILKDDPTVGTITDIDGNYEITVPIQSTVLQFRYLGYVEREEDIRERYVVNVILREDIGQLNEVVVVGYGTQKKISLTGSVAALDVKVLEQSPVANISNALSGRLPGLITVQNSGEPSADKANIWIRGIGTYQGAQSPLILVDGIERSFDAIDPNEIENLSILKDASATAVYGVRGANGVVIVQTKRGSEGKAKVSFSMQEGIQTPTRLPEYLDAYDALSLYREGLINDGLNYALYTDEYLAKFRDRSNPTYQYLYPNINWTDKMLKDYSTMTRGNINISGGSPKVKYFISAGYLRQNGLYNHDDATEDYDIQVRSQRYNFRSNVDINISKNVDVEVNLGGIVADTNYPGANASEIFSTIQRMPSWALPITNPDGSIAERSNTNSNPYALLTQKGYKRYFNTTLQATAGFVWRLPFITEGLSFRTRMSFDAYNYRNVTRSKSYKSYTYSTDESNPNLDEGTYTLHHDGITTLDYDVSANGSRTDLLEIFLNYDRTFGHHQLAGMLMYNQQEHFAAVSGGSSNATKGLPYRRQGLVFRGTYNYKSRYFFELNAGYNGSENFPSGKRFGFFPAVSASWVISNEDFIKNKTSLIDLLRIRASFGEVGNDNIGSDKRFLYQSIWDTGTHGYQFGSTRQGFVLKKAYESATGNPNVTWERAQKSNIGLDVTINKNILSFSGDLFYEKRKNILTPPLTIPDLIGIGSLPMINAGVVSNKGFELELGHQQNFKNIGYFVKANYSFARNKILEKDEPDYTGREWQAQTNRRIGEFYGLTAIGLFQSWDEINDPETPRQTFGSVQPGDIRYADLNGDNVIDGGDEGYLGKVKNPESFFGISLGGFYKNIDLSVLFQGATGGYTWWTGPRIWPFDNRSNVLKDVLDNHWSESNTPEKNASVYWPRISSDTNPNNYIASTHWLRSSNYIRLKNIEIGYYFPKSILEKCGISKARIYLSGMNLFTWDDMKIFDPEIPNNSGNYPQQKIYNIGINLSF